MIVRDEEHHLEGCLASLEDVVDEVVIVDTGSLDGSVALARSLGARVVEMPWHDNFAAARNAGLDLARGDWVLYIDAEERLLPVECAAVEPAFAAAERCEPDAPEHAVRRRLAEARAA